jgi:DNA invertase Pin-like site-specific DNA recombinase
MNMAYVRVSTVEQNEARQVEALKRHNIDRWFIEKVSGKNMERPELQKMLKTVQAGDTVFIHDFSRLARSTKDLLDIVERLQANGVSLTSDKENLDTSTPTGKLMLTMIAAINEFERRNMLDRQREGIEIAKQRNVYKGRKPVQYNRDLFDILYEQVDKGLTTVTDAAAQLGVSRPKWYRIVQERISNGQVE